MWYIVILCSIEYDAQYGLLGKSLDLILGSLIKILGCHTWVFPLSHPRETGSLCCRTPDSPPSNFAGLAVMRNTALKDKTKSN